MYHVCLWLQEGLLAPAAWWGFIFSYYLQYRSWKVQTYSNAIWCNSGRRCLSVQAWPVFWQDMQVIVIADDIMIVGKKPNHSDHDQALIALLETARCNVQLNYEKLQYKKKEVDLLGETYTTSSCKPDKNKVTAITKMPAPTNKKQLKSFIGIINYLSKFSARLSEEVEPIRGLVKDKVPLNWGPEHQSAFKQIKKRLQVLPYWLTTILRSKLSCKLMPA